MKSTDSHCFQLGGSVYSYVCEGKKKIHISHCYKPLDSSLSLEWPYCYYTYS